MLPVSLFAQVNDGIRQAMDNYDYETVVTLIEPDCPGFFVADYQSSGAESDEPLSGSHRGIELSYLERQHKHKSFDRPCRVLQIDG